MYVPSANILEKNMSPSDSF